MNAKDGLKEMIEMSIADEMPVEACVFTGEEITGMICEKVEFINVTFNNCRILYCDFTKSYFDRVVFNNCDLSNCNFSQSFWKECELTDGKAQGVKFTDSVLRKCRIMNNKLDYASFQQAALEDTVLELSLIHISLSNTARPQPLSIWDRREGIILKCLRMKRGRCFREPGLSLIHIFRMRGAKHI